jgi:hypothetical protein
LYQLRSSGLSNTGSCCIATFAIPDFLIFQSYQHFLSFLLFMIVPRT